MRRVVIALGVALLVASSCSSTEQVRRPEERTAGPTSQSPPPSSGPSIAVAPTTRPDSSTRQPDRGPVTVERDSPIGEQQTEPGPGELKLWISNQSFADDPVELAITIDSEPLIEETFHVEGQHNWVGFTVRGLEAGVHSIGAASDTGVDFDGTFTLPAGQPRWLVLNYWYYPDDADGRNLALTESDEPVAFL